MPAHHLGNVQVKLYSEGATNGPSSLILGGLSEPGPNPTRRDRDEALMSIAPQSPDREQGGSPTSVYRYYDRHGALIYVGITKQGVGRNHQHNHAADWWPHVARQDVEHLPDRPAALGREKELIRQYRPPFNKQHNIGWQELRAAYIAWAEAEKPPPDDPLDAYRRAGRSLPLDVHDFTGELLVVRTRLEQSYLVPYLLVAPGARVEGGGKRCAVQPIKVQGNFALMQCRIRRPLLGIHSVTASIRWRQSTAQSREHIAIQRVIVRPVKAPEGRGPWPAS